MQWSLLEKTAGVKVRGICEIVNMHAVRFIITMSKLVNAALVITTLIYFEQCDSVWVPAGQSYSFVCEANKQDIDSIVWQVNFQTLFLCDIISTPLTCIPAFNGLQDIYEPKITSDTLTVTSTLKIKSVIPYQDNSIVYCRIVSQSAVSSLLFTLNVFYGPDNAFLTLPNLIIDQCDIDAANISGTCTVSETIPVPNVYIYVSNSPVMSQHQINTNDFHFSHVVSESGIAYVLCRAINPVFEEISSESINYITVKGPPSTPLISSVSSQGKSLTNGNQLPVTEGNIDIFCESKGGFPLYKNITLVCGACRKSNENSDTISMTLSISSGMQGMNCTCVVSHESKCLHNFVKVSLNILKDEQNNVGAIVGGTIAAVFGAVLIAVVTVFIVRRRLKKLQTNSQAKHVNKMHTYSNVQAREDYSNSESHQYERPNFKPGPSIEVVISSPHLNSTPDLSIQPDVHTLTDIRQLKLKSNPDKFSLGGFIVHDGLTQRQFAEENIDITAHECQDEDTDGQKEKHHYEEIDDINVISRDTKDNKTEEKSKPELNSFYVNV